MCPDTIAAIEGLIAAKVTRAPNTVLAIKLGTLTCKVRLFVTFYNKCRCLAPADTERS